MPVDQKTGLMYLTLRDDDTKPLLRIDVCINYFTSPPLGIPLCYSGSLCTRYPRTGHRIDVFAS